MSDFFENYLAFQNVFQYPDLAQTADFNPKLFPAQHSIYEMFKNRQITETFAKNVPEIVVLQGLRLYSSFISPGATVKIPLISNPLSERIAKRLVELYDSKKEAINIFDEVAVLALENLFWRCYPQFLIYKGDAAINRKILEYQLKWENFMEVDDEYAAALASGNLERRMLAIKKISEEREGGEVNVFVWDEKKPLPKKIWNLIMSVFGIKTRIAFDNTKECMIATLIKPKMKKLFQIFLKVLNLILSLG